MIPLETYALELDHRLSRPLQMQTGDYDPQPVRQAIEYHLSGILRRFRNVFTDYEISCFVEEAARTYATGSRRISFADTVLLQLDQAAEDKGYKAPKGRSRDDIYSEQAFEGTGLTTFRRTRVGSPERIVTDLYN